MARHDGLLDLYVTSLQKKGYQVRHEPAIPTTAGVRYPDIVLWTGGTAYVVDVQVVADAAVGNLDTAHRRKVTYYDVPEIRDYLVSLSGNNPIFSTFIISWRGVVALPSANTWDTVWDSLGLPKGILKLMAVRALEGGAAIYTAFKKTSGARVRRVLRVRARSP